MTTLDLRNLTDAQRNDAVNEAVAMHVAGWQLHDPSETRERYRSWIPPGQKRMRDGHYTARPGKFATSADAVLPLMAKCKWWEVQCYSDIRPKTFFRVYCRPCVAGEVNNAMAESESLALSLCVALLRAHGVEVVT